MATAKVENPTPPSQTGQAWREPRGAVKLTLDQKRARLVYQYEQEQFERWAARGFHA